MRRAETIPPLEMEKILETEKEKLRTFFQNKIEQQGIKMRM